MTGSVWLRDVSGASLGLSKRGSLCWGGYWLSYIVCIRPVSPRCLVMLVGSTQAVRIMLGSRLSDMGGLKADIWLARGCAGAIRGIRVAMILCRSLPITHIMRERSS